MEFGNENDTIKQASCTTLGMVGSLISLFYPGLGLFLESASQFASLKLSIDSQKKFESRMRQFEEALQSTTETSGKVGQNYESLIIAPEILKQYMVVEDPERANEYLGMIKALFTPGKIEFDGFQEAFRVITSLSSNEYRLLRRMPTNATGWKELFPEEEYLHAQAEWASAIKRLESMYLVHLDLPLFPGPVNTHIDFKDEEKVVLTDYGVKILQTLDAVRSLGENKTISRM